MWYKSGQAGRGVRPYGGGQEVRGKRDDVGIVPYGELQGVRYKAGRRAEGSPPYKFDFVRGDGRGRTPPLRITRGAVGRDDVGIVPYGELQGVR